MSEAKYIHGTNPEEQNRLAKLNEMTNSSFLEFLELSPDSRVLEVGSGLGILAHEVARRIPHGKVVGLEYSREQLQIAERRRGENLSFRQGDARELPFENDAFDVVYCRYVLEHLSDPARALSEMHRVLRPGGRIFVQENNNLCLELYPECLQFDLLWQNFALLQEALGGDGLIGKKLLPLLTHAGFTSVRLSAAPEIHWAGTPFFEPWIRNLIANLRASEADLKTHALASPEEISSAVAELESLLKNPEGCSFFYWNRATAAKGTMV